MIRFELTARFGHAVSVFLEVDSADDVSIIRFDGVETARHAIERDVAGSPGVFGGRLDDKTNGRDLYYAMTRSPLLQQYKPRLVEGYEILGLDRGDEVTK